MILRAREHLEVRRAARHQRIRRLGFEKDAVTGHGFRATARTLLDEELSVPPHLIEHQLAHTVRDALGRAYNRTTHLRERRKMMQKWSDYLDTLRDRGKDGPREEASAPAV